MPLNALATGFIRGEAAAISAVIRLLMGNKTMGRLNSITLSGKIKQMSTSESHLQCLDFDARTSTPASVA
jgi:hypothetical protein